MLYQEYKNKMQKLVRILELIRRFRVLIIFVVLSAILLLLGFLITKGMVFGSDLEGETFEYGEEIDFSAGSLFSKVRYEYKHEDGDWSTNAPRAVGEFKVRAYGKNIFGKNRYGREFSFEVTKREVDIETKEEAIIYGEAPTPLIDGLVFGDAVSCGEFIYDDRTQIATIITPVLSSVVITDTEGNDVTGNYEINIKQNDAIAFVKRPVTITIDSDSIVYDGGVLSAEGFKITENTLAFDDKIVASEYPSIKDVGELINDPGSVFVITTPDGIDVTANYEITVVEGLLSVEPRPITIHTGSQTFIYDDTTKSFPEFTVDDSTPLAKGHTAVIDVLAEIKYASVINNALTVKILDENGNNVTSNYAIEYVYGTLEVTKRDIVINTSSEEWTYDGVAHSNTDYTLANASDLIDGHTISVTEKTTVLDATNGAVENVVKYAISLGNNDLTANYNIIYNNGTLNVFKRLLEIKTDDEAHIYDDTAFTGSSYTVTGGSVAQNQIIEIEYTAKITDAGNTPSTFNITIKHGDANVTDNYDLKLREGTLTVNERPITIASNGYTWVYDGTVHKNEDYTLLSELGVISGHTVVYVESAEIKNFADSPKPNDVKIEIFKGEENKTSNYDISYSTPGELVILKRAITITADSIKEIYNGKEISIGTYKISEPGVAPNQKETVEITATRKNYGETENTIDSVVIYDESSTDVTENYEITCVSGYINVEKRPIILASGSWEDFYDGLLHVCYEVNVVIEDGRYGIAEGEAAEYYFDNSIKNYVEGGIENTFSAVIRDANDVPTTDNYDIEYRFGRLTVNKRPITVLSGSSEEYYNGYELTNQSPITVSTEKGMGLAEGETIKPFFYGTITDYVDGGVDNTYIIEIWSGGDETTANYDITYEYGKLVIKKRPINVSTKDASKMYDGIELSEPTPSVSDKEMQLVRDHYLSSVSSTSIINAESKINETVVVVLDGSGVDKTHNYEITYSYGTLEITKRPIEIHSLDEFHTYDAELFIGSEYEIIGLDVANGQILTVTFTGGITEVSESGADNSFEIAITHNGENVLFNYDPKLVFGTLTVNKRVIEIAGVGYEWVYDGKEHKNEEYELLSELGVVSKHRVVYVESASIKNVKDSPMPNNIKIEIYEGDANKTPNYDIIYRTPGDLVITKRAITVTAGSLTEIYDGEYHSTDSYNISAPGIAENQKETVLIVGSLKNCDEIANEIIDVMIFDENGENVTENYAITRVNGVIKIEKRPIMLISASDSKIYDGTVLENHYVEISTVIGMGLAGEQSIKYVFSENAKITDYVNGGVMNLFEAFMYDGEEDTTENYDITYVYGTLIIEKRKVTFESVDDRKIYDGLVLENRTAFPHEPTEDTGVVNGQSVEYSFTGAITDYNKNGAANSFTVTIWAGEHETTNNYDISYLYGSLQIDKRPINVSTQSAQKVYDGIELSAPTPSVSDKEMQLVLDHDLSSVSSTSIINAELKTNETVVIVLDGTGADKTHNYEITYSYGTLEITKRKITVTSASDERKYDGTALTNSSFTYNTPSIENPDIGLAYGENGQYIVLSTSGAIVFVGETENKISELEIYDGNVRVTDNYEIEEIYGTLKVTERPITVTAQSQEKIYDGTPLVGSDPAIVGGDGLAKGDKLTATYIGSQKVPGTSNVRIDSFIITNGDGVDVTFCYSYADSDIFDGTFTVYEREITIIANSDSKLYDGTPLTNGGYTVGGMGLANGQSIEAINVVGSIIDAGTAKNVASGAKIVDENGDDVTECYTITYIDGELTVTKRQIAVSTGSAQKTYDGLPLVKNEGEIVMGYGDGIAPNQTYELTVTGSGTNVGEYTNTYELVIYDANGKVATHNYDINEDALGTLVIVPMELHFVTSSGEAVYTGYAFTSSQYELVSGKIASMHGTDIYTTGSQINVGKTENTLFVRIYDMESGDDSVMSNYEITVECGELVVTTRKISITTGSAQKEYDGTPLTNPECSTNWNDFAAEMASGHVVLLETTGSITEIGEKANTYNFAVTFNGEDATGNFEIDEKNNSIGILKVTPAPLVFESSSDSKIYDGTPLTNQNVALVEGMLIKGHSYKAIFYDSSKALNVQDGNVNNAFEVQIFDENGKNITDAGIYPDIICNFGTLTIEPYEMTITAGSAIKQDDGTPLYAPLYIKEPNKYLDDLNMKFAQPRFTWSVASSVAEKHYLTHVGVYEYALTDGEFIVYLDGAPVPMSNFDITYENGTLEIVGKLITIYLYELEQSYNGKPLSYEPGDWYTLGLPKGVSIKLELEGSITDVGTFDTTGLAEKLISEGKLRIYQNGVDVTHEENGFTITFEGTLTIKPCVIEVTSASATREMTDEPLTAESCWVSKNQLAPGHRIETVNYYAQKTNVGVEENDFKITKIVDENGNDVTQNYYITYKPGILEVTPSNE